jgi:signal transduction histidine kinase
VSVGQTISLSVAPLGGGGLGQLATAASRDLAGDVIITTRAPAGPSTVTATAGITRQRAKQLLPALAKLESELSSQSTLTLSALSPTKEPARALGQRGYDSVSSVRVRIGQRRVGAIHVLRTIPGDLENASLLDAYASHAAIAIAASRSRRRPRAAAPAETVEALDHLALSAMSFPDLIGELDATLAKPFGPVRCGIALWDDQRSVLYFVPGSFGVDERTAVSCQVTMVTKRSNAARVFATGDPYLSNHASGDPAIMQEYVSAFGLKRLISVRLESQRRPIGVLYLADKHEEFRFADIWRLEPLIPRISSAVEAAQTLFLLRRRHRLERILSSVAIAIASGHSIDDCLTPAMDELCDTIDASLIALVPTNAEPVVWRGGEIDIARERQLLSEAARQPGLRTKVRGPLAAGDPGSATFHVPVKLGTRRVATLSMLRRRAEPFTSDERSALVRIAKLSSLAWAMDSYQQQRAELARVAERQRIADDLHDDVAQLLFGAQMALDSTLDLPEIDERAVTNVTRARGLLMKSDDVLRGIIGQLSRESPTDLASALATTVSEVEHEYNLPIHLDIAERARSVAGDLRKPVRQAFLRTVRECLVNAAKHGGPCRALVRLDVVRGRIRLSVADDGIGIQRRAGDSHHGLPSLRRLIRDQGGNMRVVSSATGGTRVTISFGL